MNKKNTFLIIFFLLASLGSSNSFAQQVKDVPPQEVPVLYEIVENVSPERIEKDIQKLVDFGTRHTLSDTVSETRGIGAARRWIYEEFKRISEECGDCLEVRYQKGLAKGGESSRIPEDTWVVNVVAVLKGTEFPDRYVMMSGDIDSRVSDVMNATADSPGANDNASGVAGVLESARVLSKYKFAGSIMFAALSGEEQGLFGGKFLAQEFKEKGWELTGVLNNDMIGNIEGVDGVIDNTHFRIFSEPVSMLETERERMLRRYYGGEVDGPSRQLARYIARLADHYITNLEAEMIYRLDRFGRGGHHRPFNDAGFAGVRIMEIHENYNRQHQDLREENGIKYGDVIEGVNFDYAAKLTAVNAITMASLAAAPPAPEEVRIGGAVQPSTRLAWKMKDSKDLAGYKVYWRKTTAPQWQYSRFVGKTDQYTLENIIIDNYFFGVAAVDKDGNESLVVFPAGLIRD
jgi:Zn-dependent M28 family amino/carboxypeptidase